MEIQLSWKLQTTFLQSKGVRPTKQHTNLHQKVELPLTYANSLAENPESESHSPHKLTYKSHKHN